MRNGRLRFLVAVCTCALCALLLTSAVAASRPQNSGEAPPPASDHDAAVDSPTLLVTDLTADWTVGGASLYWYLDCVSGEIGRRDGFVRRMPTHGGLTRTLTTLPQTSCTQLANLSADDGGLYYWNSTAARIEKRPVGSPFDPPTLLYTPTLAVRSRLVLDGDYLYYISAPHPSTGQSRIYRAATDGSGLNQLKVITGTNPTDLVVSGDSIYWLDDAGLWAASTDCPGGIVTTCNLQRLVADAHGSNLLYQDSFLGGLWIGFSLHWIDSPVGLSQRIRVYSCSGFLSCSTRILYTAPSTAPWQLGQLGTNGTYLYWPEGYQAGITQEGRVRRMPVGGGPVVTIAENTPYNARRLFTDDLGVYFMDAPGISRLPFDASAVVRDLAFDAWEVTQGIQNLANDVPLVAYKTTYVRVYGKEISGPAAGSVEVYLYGERGGVPLPESPLQPVPLGFIGGVRSLATGVAYNRAQRDAGWMFALPESWTDAGTITLRAVVDPREVYADPDRSNNEHSATFTFGSKPPICTVFVPVSTYAPQTSTADPHFWPMVDLFKRLWPVPAVWVFHQDESIGKPAVCWGGLFGEIPYPCTVPFDLPGDGSAVLDWLKTRAFFSSNPFQCDAAGSHVMWVGGIHWTVSAGADGLGRHEDPVSWVLFPRPYEKPSTDWSWPLQGPVLAQELGHNMDRYHVNCPVGGPANIDASYPYPTCQLDFDTPAAHYGFDVNTRTPISPKAATDFMSYQPSFWVSDYTWRALYGLMAASAAGPAAQAEAAPASSQPQHELAAAADIVFASGVVTPSLNQGALHTAWVFPSGALGQDVRQKWLQVAAPRAADALTAAGSDATHAYHLRVIAADGISVLDDRTITPAMDSGHLALLSTGFELTFPAPAAAVGRVELMDGAAVLATLQPGSATPVVGIVQPVDGQVVSDALTVMWQAADPDPGDKLVYVLQYSPDEGLHWYSLVTNYAGPLGSPVISLTLSSLSGIPGSTQGGRIRVAASDGYHTALATSARFFVSNRPPQPYIVLPIADQTVPAGESVVLSGGASDAEDGGLSGEALTWTVDGVPAGSGDVQRLDGLAPGSYDIALTARDSSQQSATAHASLTVGELRVPMGAAPALDGYCDDPEYAHGVTLQLAPYPGGAQGTVHLLRSSTDLWVCFSGLSRSTGPGASAGVLVDVNNSHDPLAQPSDLGFAAGEDGTVVTSAGNGGGGYGSGPGGLRARTSANDSSWNAELVISASVLGGWGHQVGLGLANYWLRYTGDDYHWPYAAAWERPNTWAQAFLGDNSLYLPTVLRKATPGQGN